MSDSWPRVQLGDVAAAITVGHVGPMASEYVPQGIPFLRSQDVEPFRIKTTDLKYISERFHRRLAKSALRPGDVVIVRTGRPGSAAVIPDDLREANCSDVVVIRPGDRIDARFVCYVLNSAAQAHVRAHLVGAVQQHFNVGSARTISFALPPLDEQQRISALLGGLDDKIALNRRTNESLESLITSLYARMATGSENWETSSIGGVVSVRGGATPSTGEPRYWATGDGFAWATPKDLSNLVSPALLATERHITEQGLTQISSGLLPIGSVLLSSRAPIGYLAIAEIPTAVNQGFIAMVCDGSLPNYYVWQWTKQNLNAIKARANGSTFQEVSKANFRPMLIPIPPKQVLARFVAEVDPLYRLIVANTRESQTLAELRDTLLPELISGRIRVGDMEAAVGAAV